MKIKSFKRQSEDKHKFKEKTHLRNLKKTLEDAVVCAFVLKENAAFFDQEGFVNAMQYCKGSKKRSHKFLILYLTRELEADSTSGGWHWHHF